MVAPDWSGSPIADRVREHGAIAAGAFAAARPGNRDSRGPRRRPSAFDTAVPSGRTRARRVWWSGRSARIPLDGASAGGSASGTRPAARIVPCGLARDRIHYRGVADLRTPLRHHPRRQGQPVDARSVARRPCERRRGQPLALRHDCHGSRLVHVLAVRRGIDSAEFVDADFHSRRLRSQSRASDANQAAGQASRTCRTSKRR